MRHQYVSTAHFRSPFKSAPVQGLGLTVARAPSTTAWFRSPYKHGYFQDNALEGVSGEALSNLTSIAPGSIKRFVKTGQEPLTLGRDIPVPFRQVNRWIYAAIGVGASALSYRSYRRWQKKRKK